MMPMLEVLPYVLVAAAWLVWALPTRAPRPVNRRGHRLGRALGWSGSVRRMR